MPSSSYLSSYEQRGTGGGGRTSSSSASSVSTAASAKKASAERNQQVLRTLLNDPGNKYCGDCKTSGHPRWASWSIGVFLCIRCSGIHRSMGTHISRGRRNSERSEEQRVRAEPGRRRQTPTTATNTSKVRSIDLDSWTDEQIENMVKWGNKRANLYWEFKLPDNYTPDDSKIANFIRTKYDLKRWVKPGGVPDPSTLGEHEPSQNDSTPLSEVKSRLTNNDSRPPVVPKKSAGASNLIPDLLGGSVNPTSAAQVGLQRTTVNSTASGTNSNVGATISSRAAPPAVPAKNDLLGGLDFGGASGGASANSVASTPTPKSDSLLGLDFTNSSTTITPKPSLANQQQKSQQSRPDLKKSILSLYAPAAARPVVPAAAAPTSFGFDSLTNQTNHLSIGSSGVPPPVHKSKPSSTQNNLFDNLISGSSSSAWASTPTEHAVHTRKPSEDEWASFSSAPPTKQAGGADEDLFQNVWK